MKLTTAKQPPRRTALASDMCIIMETVGEYTPVGSLLRSWGLG